VTGQTALAGLVQVLGTTIGAPLIPGLTQTIKARLQGRRGASPLQPYRELARLFGKSVVDPIGSGPVYRAVPAIVVSAVALACLLVPVAGRAPGWPVGHDAFILFGLLALARFAIAASAWDTGSGFALQGASRAISAAWRARARGCTSGTTPPRHSRSLRSCS
jgi:formate hydrogenlyase subunit 4